MIKANYLSAVFSSGITVALGRLLVGFVIDRIFAHRVANAILLAAGDFGLSCRRAGLIRAAQASGPLLTPRLSLLGHLTSAVNS